MGRTPLGALSTLWHIKKGNVAKMCKRAQIVTCGDSRPPKNLPHLDIINRSELHARCQRLLSAGLCSKLGTIEVWNLKLGFILQVFDGARQGLPAGLRQEQEGGHPNADGEHAKAK